MGGWGSGLPVCLLVLKGGGEAISCLSWGSSCLCEAPPLWDTVFSVPKTPSPWRWAPTAGMERPPILAAQALRSCWAPALSLEFSCPAKSGQEREAQAGLLGPCLVGDPGERAPPSGIPNPVEWFQQVEWGCSHGSPTAHSLRDMGAQLPPQLCLGCETSLVVSAKWVSGGRSRHSGRPHVFPGHGARGEGSGSAQPQAEMAVTSETSTRLCPRRARAHLLLGGSLRTRPGGPARHTLGLGVY